MSEMPLSLDRTRGLAKIPPFIQNQQRLVPKVREHPVKNNKVMFKLNQMEHKCKLKRTPKVIMEHMNGN